MNLVVYLKFPVTIEGGADAGAGAVAVAVVGADVGPASSLVVKR